MIDEPTRVTSSQKLSFIIYVNHMQVIAVPKILWSDHYDMCMTYKRNISKTVFETFLMYLHMKNF